MNIDCIILAGGKGSRMEDDLPKALVLVKNKPIISYQIDYLSPKVDKIILALGYKADQVVNYIKKSYPEKNIDFSIEEEPLGTGGAIKLAMKKSDSEKILVLNCDDITDIDPEKLSQNKENTICVAHPRLPFGLVKEKEGYAVFEEKPVLSEWVSCGWYLFYRKEIFDLLPEKGSIEYDTFPKTKLRVYEHEGFWNTLNSKKDIAEFEEEELPGALKN